MKKIQLTQNNNIIVINLSCNEFEETVNKCQTKMALRTAPTPIFWNYNDWLKNTRQNSLSISLQLIDKERQLLRHCH